MNNGKTEFGPIFVLLGLLFPLLVLPGCRLSFTANPPAVSPTPTTESLYSDETIRLIVPFSTGGGTDTWSRTIAPYMQRHLGNKVQVQVINKPGASGVSGTNSFIYSHDDKTILVSSGSVIYPYLLGDKSVEYEFNELVPILGSSIGGVVFVSPETGIRSVRDLCTYDQQLIYGGISASGSDIVPLVSFELLKMDVHGIFGFDGKGPSRIAFEQGETDIEYQTTPGYLANVERLTTSQKIVPLFAFGLVDNQGQVVRDPVFPELPTVKEVYNTCFGEDPAGVEWEVYKATLTAGFTIQKMMWVHSDAPEEAITELRNAAAAAVEDPEFKEASKNLIGDYDFFVGHEAQVTFAAASSLTPDEINWLKRLLTEKYGGRFD